MPKKSKNNKQPILLIISMCMLALILIGVVTYQWILNKKDMDLNTNVTETAVGKWISNSIFKTREPAVTDTEDTETTSEAIAVNDKITYTIFQTYIMKADLPVDQVSFASSDFSEGEIGVAKGFDVDISVTAISDGQTLETQKEELRQLNGFSEVTNTTIDDVPALKYHFDGEGVHSLQYYAIKDDYSLTIVIGSKDLNAEKSYQTQINSIVSSIQFK